ncbi:hypothetical protein SDC9_94350 [bioreactor metagenome]|uniref:Uncharacterized protein n=1 Tax=bioreactor metagenome TaxID=1076179 RepID=A0A645A374_9ZZZZ
MQLSIILHKFFDGLFAPRFERRLIIPTFEIHNFQRRLQIGHLCFDNSLPFHEHIIPFFQRILPLLHPFDKLANFLDRHACFFKAINCPEHGKVFFGKNAVSGFQPLHKWKQSFFVIKPDRACWNIHNFRRVFNCIFGHIFSLMLSS